MPCSTEHPTTENHATPLYVQHQLSRISHQWQEKVAQKYSLRSKQRKTFALKWNTWARAVRAKKQEVKALLDKQTMNPYSVTSADWDALLRDSVYKVVAILSLPRTFWPSGATPLTGLTLMQLKHNKMRRATQDARIKVQQRKDQDWKLVRYLWARAQNDERNVSIGMWVAAYQRFKSIALPEHLKETYPPLACLNIPTIRGYIERARERQCVRVAVSKVSPKASVDKSRPNGSESSTTDPRQRHIKRARVREHILKVLNDEYSKESHEAPVVDSLPSEAMKAYEARMAEGRQWFDERARASREVSECHNSATSQGAPVDEDKASEAKRGSEPPAADGEGAAAPKAR